MHIEEEEEEYKADIFLKPGRVQLNQNTLRLTGADVLSFTLRLRTFLMYVQILCKEMPR